MVKEKDKRYHQRQSSKLGKVWNNRWKGNLKGRFILYG